MELVRCMVVTGPDADDKILVVIAGFDRDQPFGPLPYLASAGAPAPDDEVLALTDNAGAPQLVLCPEGTTSG